MGKRKITITVDEKVFAAYKRFCQANAMKVSTKTEHLMRDFVEHGDEQRLHAPNKDEKEERE